MILTWTTTTSVYKRGVIACTDGHVFVDAFSGDAAEALLKEFEDSLDSPKFTTAVCIGALTKIGFVDQKLNPPLVHLRLPESFAGGKKARGGRTKEGEEPKASEGETKPEGKAADGDDLPPDDPVGELFECTKCECKWLLITEGEKQSWRLLDEHQKPCKECDNGADFEKIVRRVEVATAGGKDAAAINKPAETGKEQK